MILTIRFNNDTWINNNNYRDKHKIHCIYASPNMISQTIDINKKLFIIEMNNSINQIIGIGLIRNRLYCDKRIPIQEDFNYNRYFYKGNHHINREFIINHNNKLLEILEKLLFKGYSHSKRGSGFTKFPLKLLENNKKLGLNIYDEIVKLFIIHKNNNK